MNFLISLPVSLAILFILIRADPSESQSIGLSQTAISFALAFGIVMGIREEHYSYTVVAVLLVAVFSAGTVWQFRKTWINKWKNGRSR